MRRVLKRILILMTVCFMCVMVSACSSIKESGEVSLWDNAIYTEDTELGTGVKTVCVEVKTEEKNITFTIKTDKETLGDALKEHNLISGEEGAYGIYIKSVNGITADYNVDKSYWAFEKDGEQMMTGVDDAKISDGDRYELVYTK